MFTAAVSLVRDQVKDRLGIWGFWEVILVRVRVYAFTGCRVVANGLPMVTNVSPSGPLADALVYPLAPPTR